MDATSTMRIVILGKTGTGKSSVANTIFGEEVFKIGHTLSSETSSCQAETRSVNGKSITLVDTPGFFNTSRPEEELKPEIVRCITECAPGPHAFLIVIKLERSRELEQAVIMAIKSYFSEEVFKYATILFTDGDQLPEGQTIEDAVRENKSMNDLVKKCGGRCHIIDNKYWKNEQQDEYRSNRFQVFQLLKTIEKTWLANNGRFYTNEMLRAVKKKGRVSMKLLFKLAAGVATGVLFGGFFGVAAGVFATVVAIAGIAAIAAKIGK